MSSENADYIDLSTISEIADGDEEFMLEIIGNYLTTVSESSSELHEAILDRNENKIIFFAHKLKGSFAFVGVEKLHRLASEIEANASAPDELLPLFREMMVLADKVDAQLKLILSGQAL
jgi:HPt (histidine-containing phosphotransfer) domain-containing protein